MKGVNSPPCENCLTKEKYSVKPRISSGSLDILLNALGSFLSRKQRVYFD